MKNTNNNQKINKTTYTVADYRTEVKSLVITHTQFSEFAKIYKQNNKKDTLNNLLLRFLDKINSRKITNDDLNIFDYITNLFIIDEQNKKKILNRDKFILKSNLQEIYKKCQNFDVVATKIENGKIFSMDFKHKSPYKTFCDLYKKLLAVKKTIKTQPKTKNKKSK